MELGVWREERVDAMNEMFVWIVMKYLPIGCLYVLPQFTWYLNG